MVRRKPSRAVSARKIVKTDIKIKDDNENEVDAKIRAESLKKRLNDFDMQVEETMKTMEADKEKLVTLIKNLYFIDEQRSTPDVNNMLWQDYLKLNSIPAPSSIRKSIAEITELAENTKLLQTAKKRGRKPGKSPPSKAPATTRTLRSRSKAEPFITPLATETPVNNLKGTLRGRKKAPESVMSTPANQGIPFLPGNIITPKFDPRTPLPLSAMRRPKFGEITLVSFSGSPVQVNPKDMESDLEDASRDELEALQAKLIELLKN